MRNKIEYLIDLNNYEIDAKTSEELLKEKKNELMQE